MHFSAIVSPILLRALTGLTLSLSIALPAVAQGNNRSDELVLDMAAAFKKSDRKRLSQLLPQLRGHVLESWAAYWELRARLDEASASEVQDFLRRHAGTYAEDRLRNDWLLLLGSRRDWAAFSEELPRYRMNDDLQVRCYAALVEAQRQGSATPPAVAEEVRRTWLAQREADDGCVQAAAKLIELKLFNPLDAWRKARLALEYNRVGLARNAVQVVAPDAVGAFNEMTANPAKFLAARVTAPTRARRELVLLAIVKMATSDPDAAAGTLDRKWSVHLTPEERNWAWGAIGRQSAQRLSDEALDHYGHVTHDHDLTDDMLGWRVRAALRTTGGPARQARWPLVLQSVQAMSEEARKDPTWVYWRARALLAQAASQRTEPAAASRAEATALLESIAGVKGFYEQLALEELGRKISVPPRPAPLTAEEREAARLNPGLNRALYAVAIGLRPEGVREWNYSTNLVNGKGEKGGMSERELLAAADFACERQVWDRCINTSDRTRQEIDFSQRFPMPFRDAVVKRSNEIALDPAYVYGLIRQESRFIMDARSGVGASGLMQVMPATARWTARKIGLNSFTIDQLNDRDTNIAIGTGYLKLVLDNFEGSLPMAAAAYNAGPSRPRNWRAPGGSGPVLEAAAWAENIPFNETRDYVKKVLSNTTNYAALITGQPQSLKARLGTVGPRDAAAPPEAVKDLP